MDVLIIFGHVEGFEKKLSENVSSIGRSWAASFQSSPTKGAHCFTYITSKVPIYMMGQ